jgi:hypothetical protein
MRQIAVTDQDLNATNVLQNSNKCVAPPGCPAGAPPAAIDVLAGKVETAICRGT